MRRLAALLCIAVSLIHVPLDRPAAAEASPPAAFTFIHVTDTHVGSSEGNKNTPRVFDEIAQLPEKPAFIIHGGDESETGAAPQYDLLAEFERRAGVPVFHVPGNHDARWSDAGKAGFTGRFGAKYRSFDHQGVHFVLLDTSIDAETHGHVDRSMLDWLAADLRQVGPDRPVLIFAHHPLAYAASRFIDNDEDFLETIAPYNVAAVFTGHGHLHLEWAHNGVRYFMTAAAMDAGYKILRVAPVNEPAPGRAATPFATWEMQVENKVVGQPGQPLLPVPLGRAAARPELRVEASAPDAENGFDVGGDRVSLRAVASGFQSGLQKVEVRVGLGKWEPLVPVGAPAGAGGVASGTDAAATAWTGELSAADWPAGFHEIVVRATDAAGSTWSRRVFARKPAAAGAAAIAWRFRAGGGIQGAPAVAGGLAIFGANDGKVYAVDVETGEARWSFATGGPVVSTPAVSGDTVYAGSADRRVYALDLNSGRPRWTFEAGGAVVAPPLVVDGRVFLGAGDGKMYALDAAGGGLVWAFPARDLIRGRAAFGRGAVYFGSWDGNVYAVDAATGRPRWTADLSRQIYFAPANGDLLYHRGRVYVTTPGDARAGGTGIWALDAADGSVRWKRSESAGFSSPSVRAGDVVYHLTNGTVQAVRPLSGEVAWTAATGWSSYDSSPVAAGRDVVIGSLGGRVTAVDPLDKTVSWRVQLGNGFIFARPAVVPPGGAPGGAGRVRVLVGSMDGTLAAIDAPLRPAPAAPAFVDLDGHWAAEAARRLALDGVITGYPGGVFGPDRPVSRAEMAAMVARYLAAKGPSTGYRSSLADLDGHWAADLVRALEERGIIQGYGAAASGTGASGAGASGTASSGAGAPPSRPGGPALKRFEPGRQVSRAEAAVMLARAIGAAAPTPAWKTRLADVASHWAAREITALEERGIVRGEDASGRTVYRPDAPITRAEVAALLDRLLQ